MIVGVGLDVVEVARLGKALDRTPSLADRLFADGERGLPIASLAAKEAAAKALGGPRGPRWLDAEVVTGDRGRPSLQVTGSLADFAERAGVTRWHLSLTHDAGLAHAPSLHGVAVTSAPSSGVDVTFTPGDRGTGGPGDRDGGRPTGEAAGLGWV